VTSSIETVIQGMADLHREILLIGGHALPAYGVVRQTVDVDFLLSDQDDTALQELMLAKGYVEVARTNLFVRYVDAISGVMDVDVLLVDPSTFAAIYSDSRSYSLADLNLQIPALPHLIALKLHAIKSDSRRELKDLLDVVELLRQNPQHVPAGELKEICLQYGPEGIYEKLEHYR
jgi:hypothetical protein